MQRYTDYDRDLQDAVRRLAEAATASASEKKHDAKMATIANNAANTVHEVLERSAQRARLYGWITGGVSVTIALVAVIVASSIAQGARDMKQSYDRALTRATTESIALHDQLDSSKKRWEAMQLSREEDRSILSNTLEKLTLSYDRLLATTSSQLKATQQQPTNDEHDSLTTPSNSSQANPLPASLTMTRHTTPPNSLANISAERITRSPKAATKLKSSASRRLVDTMRSQRSEARGQVEELFEVYTNDSGSCIGSR